jgi:hypothetical protein
MMALQEMESHCRARIAEKAGHWSKASHHWRRAHDYERAEAAELKAIEEIPDAARRGQEWMRLGEWVRAIACFAECGDSLNQQIATARHLERQHDWGSAARIWGALNRPANQAYCLTQIAGRATCEEKTAQEQGTLFS